MSHKGNDNFIEALREMGVDVKEVTDTVTALPKSNDTDYWKEREDQESERYEAYGEAHMYDNR